MDTLDRRVRPFAEEALAHFPALVIEGARQVGKSTLAGMITAGRGATVLTLDDPEVLAAARADPRGFVDQSPTTLVIDEAQRFPELSVSVKASIDRDRTPGRFILTGSADFLRQSASTDSLAGRSVSLRLFGFNQAELGQTGADLVPALLRWLEDRRLPVIEGTPRADILDRIVAGGYPATRGLSDRLRSAWLDSYVSSLVQRDAVGLQRVEPSRLMSVLRLIAARQGAELVKATLAQEAALPASSVTAYLDILQRLFLVDAIRPWTPNLTKRETGRPKLFVTDSGLAARLCGVTAPSLAGVPAPAALGGLAEGFVAAELLAAAAIDEAGFRLYHYRDRNGREVDFVIELFDGRVIGVEVKASQSNSAAQFAGLRFLEQKLGDRFLGGVVLSMAPRTFRFTDRLWGLPFSAFWLPTTAP